MYGFGREAATCCVEASRREARFLKSLSTSSTCSVLCCRFGLITSVSVSALAIMERTDVRTRNAACGYYRRLVEMEEELEARAGFIASQAAMRLLIASMKSNLGKAGRG